MKDIYELLNEVSIDDIEKEEMEVSELERKRGKKKLMASIKNRRSMSKKIVMVASLVVIIGTASIVVAKPVWAIDIPVIGDLIQLSLVNNNSNYEDYIEAVGTTKSDQGIDITFESAIADRNVLNLEFVVKNNNESIEENFTDALLIPTSLKVNGKSVSTGAGATYEVIDANTVRILKNISWDYGKLPSKLNIDIEIAEMFGKAGNWDVSFALDSKEIEENTYVEKLDKVINIDEVDYKITDIIMTPLTTNIEYKAKYKEKPEFLQFIIFDENGNPVINDSGGYRNSRIKKISGYATYTSNEEVKTLNITPYYSKSDANFKRIKEEKLPPTKIKVDSFSPINLKVNEDSSIDINECIIDGDFLVIDYSFKYLDKHIQNAYYTEIYVNLDTEEGVVPVSWTNIIHNYTEEEQEKADELYIKYNKNNGRNMINVVKIGNERNIEIGAYDGTSTVILKDEAFTVTKK